MYSVDDFVNDTFFHNKLVGNPLPLDRGVNTSYNPLFPLSLIKLAMVATCWFSSVRNLVPVFPGSAQWMILTTEVIEICQDQDVKFGLQHLSLYYWKIYLGCKMIAKSPLGNLMSSVPSYSQSLVQGSDSKCTFNKLAIALFVLI